MVKATLAGEYGYWLSQEDIADIARLKYQRFQTLVNYDNHFEIIGSFIQLKKIVKKFLARIKVKIENNVTRGTVLTLIIHQAKPSKHWTSLVIYRELNHNIGIYLDSTAKNIPNEYQIFFDANNIEIINLTKYFRQQQDGCNCGLWALENAEDVNLMLHHEQDKLWAFNELKRPRDKHYFDAQRRELAELLVSDLDWRNRHPNSEEDSTPEQSISLSNPSSRTSPDREPETSPDSEPEAKRFKVDDRKEIFIETLINNLSQRIAACHVIAREGRITEEAFRTELLTGITGSLLGAADYVNCFMFCK